MFRLCAVLAVGAAFPAAAANPLASTTYERKELSIPMRDGTLHFAVALIPKGATGPLPILLIRTAFSAAREFRTADLPASLRELGEDGYIFVTEDIRGRFGSEGTFVTSRPMADPRDPRGVDESTDAWDTIDWLIKQLPANSGKVGVLGVSYRGWLAGLAGVHPHPALKAISPQAPSADTWLGDDFFHQGAFRQTQGVIYSAYIEGTNGLAIPDYDQFQFYLRQATLSNIGKTAGVAELPSWVGFRSHPAYDAYWQARAMQRVLTSSEVPTLFVGGVWDEEDILGASIGYRTLEAHDAKGLNRLVLGPWSHGAWARGSADSLGPIALGSATGDYFRDKIQRPWFAWYLHGKGDGHFPEVWAFETGANKWRTFDAWPARESTSKKFYLHAQGVLSFDPPKPGKEAFDAYRADPAHPVPNTPRPDDGSAASSWLQQDQRFVDGRPDVLTWVSAALTSDITVVGNVVAHLFASTTGTDADWVVKLIDVYPEEVADHPQMGGYQFMVNADILRGRYWKGFERATPIPANRVIPYQVDLHEQLYRFLKGHRIMVQVQSSWFPMYDRNPQRFVANIFEARVGDFQPSEHRVWHTPAWPSHIAVRVMP
ncbi:MAG: CocE/NonD family hydrolase [Gemmatimonadota bacterium]